MTFVSMSGSCLPVWLSINLYFIIYWRIILYATIVMTFEFKVFSKFIRFEGLMIHVTYVAKCFGRMCR